MTNPNVQNAEEESGNPGFGGQTPTADNTESEVDPQDVAPTQDASKDEESVKNPTFDTDKGVSG